MATPTEILTAGGLANADLIVQAATATGIPLAILAAMVQKESGGQNVYGHDAGGVFSTLYGSVTVEGVTIHGPLNVGQGVTVVGQRVLLDRLWLGHRQGLGFRWLLHLGRLQQIDDERDFHDLRHDCFGGEHHQKNGDVQTNNNAKQTAAPR